jgi:hypothetical protein
LPPHPLDAATSPAGDAMTPELRAAMNEASTKVGVRMDEFTQRMAKEIGAQVEARSVVCARCPAALRDSSFMLCPACALVAEGEVWGDYDTIAADPFVVPEPMWMQRVWREVKAGAALYAAFLIWPWRIAKRVVGGWR